MLAEHMYGWALKPYIKNASDQTKDLVLSVFALKRKSFRVENPILNAQT